jgi:6-phosphogluconate dehydrogenase
MAELAQIGVTGLAVMGRNLARNFPRARASGGDPQSLLRPRPSHCSRRRLEGTFIPSESMADFVASLGSVRAEC